MNVEEENAACGVALGFLALVLFVTWAAGVFTGYFFWG